MITEEMVKEAWRIFDTTSEYENFVNYETSMRAALEAVATMIVAQAFETRPPALLKDALDKAINKAKAQGMLEAADIANVILGEDCVDAFKALEAIEARAQELDPK